MSLYGSSVEYGLHCLLYLVFPKEDFLPSSKDMAEFQGISPSYVAKLFTQLQKAGIVQSVEGIKGGFELKRPAKEISVLDVADALEGKKPLFQCKDIRHGCVLHKGSPPIWATSGVCGIHAVMLEGEQRMREALAGHSLADIAERTGKKIPRAFMEKSIAWFEAKQSSRQSAK